MHTTHAIVGHAVLVPLVLAVLVAAILAGLRLDARGHEGRRLSDPLDRELVRRWNARLG